MARGLVMWAQLHEENAITGPSPAVYCHNKELYRPHEAEQLHAWARAVRDQGRMKGTPVELVASTVTPVENPLVVARSIASSSMVFVEGLRNWQLLKGLRCLGGNWLLYNEHHNVGILVGTNTTDAAYEAMLEECVRTLAALHGWKILE